MKYAVLACLLALAACGADGPPTAQQSGVTLGGEIRVGVSGRL